MLVSYGGVVGDILLAFGDDERKQKHLRLAWVISVVSTFTSFPRHHFFPWVFPILYPKKHTNISLASGFARFVPRWNWRFPTFCFSKDFTCTISFSGIVLGWWGYSFQASLSRTSLLPPPYISTHIFTICVALHLGLFPTTSDMCLTRGRLKTFYQLLLSFLLCFMDGSGWMALAIWATFFLLLLFTTTTFMDGLDAIGVSDEMIFNTDCEWYRSDRVGWMDGYDKTFRVYLR